MSDITTILSKIDQGDPSAAEQILPLVYDELRSLAAACMAREQPGPTLQATALVHEAYTQRHLTTFADWSSSSCQPTSPPFHQAAFPAVSVKVTRT